MYQTKYLGKFIGLNNENDVWYKLCVYYYAKTELYDRTLTDLRSPHDSTEAYIDGSTRKHSLAYSKRIRNFILSIGKELGLIDRRLNDFRHYRYSAQKWIDEYDRLTDIGELDFINRYLTEDLRMNKETVFLDALLYAMEGDNPSKAIENQERRGQQSVIRNHRLPIKTNGGAPNEYTKQQYERMGIKIIGEYDDLFYSVELPDGWEIKATSHHMWNNLFDDKGRKRANFFYKAAFYDRDAFINFNTRFCIDVDHVVDASSDYDVWKNSDYQGTVKDGEEIIFSTECMPATGSYDGDYKVKNTLRKTLEKYMNENYPNYTDINAYWD